MIICIYCDKPCLKNQEVTPYDEHRICVTQKEQRYKDRVCIRCGKHDDNYRVQCELCRSQANPSYVGYNGPT